MHSFRHKLNVRVVQRRLLSTVEGNVAAKGGETAKKSNTFKYIIIGVPTLILGTIVTDIVCNVNHRKALEKFSPSFVALVREHYGFDDENPAELARIKFVKEQLARPVDIRVHAERGEEVTLPQVSGTKSVVSVLDGLAREAFPQMASVDFSYSNGDNNSNSENDHPSERAKDVTGSGDSNVPAVRPDHRGWNTMRPSVWATLPGGSQTGAAQGAVVYGKQEEDMRRYEDYYGDFSKGVRIYAENGSGLVPLGESKAGSAPRRARPSVAKRPSSAATDADLVRIRAKQRIEDLQREIVRLEGEKRMGVREIDAVEADIRSARQQIAEVQRRHLNYFYYF